MVAASTAELRPGEKFSLQFREYERSHEAAGGADARRKLALATGGALLTTALADQVFSVDERHALAVLMARAAAPAASALGKQYASALKAPTYPKGVQAVRDRDGLDAAGPRIDTKSKALVAVRQNGNAYVLLPEFLRRDRDVLLAAVKAGLSDTSSIPKDMITRSFVLQWLGARVKSVTNPVQLITGDLRNDVEFARLACTIDPKAYAAFTKPVQQDGECAAIHVKQQPSSFFLLDSAVQRDPKVQRAARATMSAELVASVTDSSKWQSDEQWVIDRLAEYPQAASLISVDAILAHPRIAQAIAEMKKWPYPASYLSEAAMRDERVHSALVAAGCPAMLLYSDSVLSTPPTWMKHALEHLPVSAKTMMSLGDAMATLYAADPTYAAHFATLVRGGVEIDKGWLPSNAPFMRAPSVLHAFMERDVTFSTATLSEFLDDPRHAPNQKGTLGELQALAQSNPPAYAQLRTRLAHAHIVYVNRFSSLAQLSSVLTSTEGDPSDKRPVALFAFNRFDWNGAYHRIGDEMAKLQKGYRVVYVEGASDTELFGEIDRQLNGAKASVIVQGGHGTGGTLTLGEWTEGTASGSETLDTKDGHFFKRLHERMAPNATLISDSCQNGAGGATTANLANTEAAYMPDATIIAMPRDMGAGALQVDASGLLTGVRFDGSDEQYVVRANSGALMLGVSELPKNVKDITTFDLKTYAGKPVVLEFFASWCGPCRAAAAHVKELQQKYGKDVHFVGIAIDGDNTELAKMLEEAGIDWDVYQAQLGWEDDAVNRFGINSVPAILTFDAKGKAVGVVKAADLEAAITTLKRGQ